MLPSKWENFSRSTKSIHVCKNLPHALDCRQQIISVNIQYFFNFGRGFCGSFSMLFPKAPASQGKKS